MPPDSSSSPAPYVSVVLTGRNDGYGGDFLGRFLATLHFNSRELTARGVPHEFVLVEWAPPSDRPGLADLVDAHCPASVTSVFRTIAVDPAYDAAVMQNPRLKYQEYLAKNVGIRRARGEYLILTNCDIFLGRHILGRLEQRTLRPSIVYRAPRWDLTEALEVEGIGWAQLEDPTSLSGEPRTIEPPYYSGGAGDFTAMDRASCERLGGFNEVYRRVRISIDGNLLVHALSSGLTIEDIGGPVYHIDHAGSYRSSRTSYAGREDEAPYGDDRWPANVVVYRNRPNWGLLDAPERAAGPRRTVLDFSWEAVPPLVDLAGLVFRKRPAIHQGAASGGADGAPGRPETADCPLQRALDALGAVGSLQQAVRSVPASDPSPALHTAAAALLEGYRRALAELRTLAQDARRTLHDAPSVEEDAHHFAHRRRRTARKIAARRTA